MTKITEDFVSFETAKLLKEKNCPDFGYSCICDSEGNKAQTQSIIMKWLREVHNILLFLLPAQENGKLIYLVEVWTWNEEEGIYESTYAPMPRKEPEEALEAAIKYSLEHLI